MARITIDCVLRETAVQVRAHLSAFVTLAAAFVFLPALIAGLVAPAPTFHMPKLGAMPQFPPWFWATTIVTLGLQMLASLTVASIAGNPRRPIYETVGTTLARMMSALSRYVGAILLLCVAYLIVSVPVLLVLAMGTGAASALGGSSSPQGALAAQQVGGVFLLFALPVMLWVCARLSPMLGVFAAEPVGPVGGIRRAWALSRKSAGKLVLLLILIAVALLLLSVLGQGLGGALGSLAAFGGSMALARVVTLIVAGLVGAASFIGIAAGQGVVYRQLLRANVPV